MDSLVKKWEALSESNQLLFKKSLIAGVGLYVILLAIHDLMPYAIIGASGFYLYKLIKQN